jgi:hypothetical protein
MQRRTFSFLAIVVGLIVALLPQVSRAFSFSPDRMFVELAPGREQKMTFTIKNETTKPANAHVAVRAFTASGEAGKPLFTDAHVATSIEPFVILSATDITLKAGEVRPYAFTMKVPESAIPGSYFGAIHVAIGAGDDAGGAVAVTGPLVFLTVPGTVPSAAAITISSVSTPSGTVTALPDGMNVTLRNAGTFVVVPTGTVRVRNLVGGIAREYSLNLAGAALLPGDERTFLVGDAGSMDSSFMNELANFGIGPYWTGVHVDAPHVASVDLKSPTYWVVPWRAIGAAALFSLLIATLLAFLFPRRRTTV